MHNHGLIPYYKYLIYRYGSQHIIEFFQDHKFTIHKDDGEFGHDFYAIMAPQEELFDDYNENYNYEDDDDWDNYIFSENRVIEDILVLIKILKINKIRKIIESQRG